MDPLGKLQAKLKTGDEPLVYHGEALPFTLLDFWRWSVSDILSNATRGRLAEFIVASAARIPIKEKAREEWSPFDLETEDGIKIEVKSAAYIQTWFQKSLSKISFSTKPALHWDSQTNVQSKTAKRSADVYVFCLLHHDKKQSCDPLNLNHWEFYVLSTYELDNYKRSQHSITLKSLQGLTNAIGYDRLGETIRIKNDLGSNQNSRT